MLTITKSYSQFSRDSATQYLLDNVYDRYQYYFAAALYIKQRSFISERGIVEYPLRDFLLQHRNMLLT